MIDGQYELVMKWWYLENLGPIEEFLCADPPYYGPFNTFEEAFEEWKKAVGWANFPDVPQDAETFKRDYLGRIAL